MEDLKPKVIVNGGFNKNGAIVEGSQEIEYERTAFGRVHFDLYFEEHRVIFSKKSSDGKAEEADELTREDKELARISVGKNYLELEPDLRLQKYAVRNESLFGKAQIRKASYGEYSFSFFGSEKQFTELSLCIERSDVDRLIIFGFRDLEESSYCNEEGFSIEMRLRPSLFDELKGKILKGYMSAVLSVSLSRGSRLFATWSPINEGGVIKYLATYSDLENPEDLPEHFREEIPYSMEFSLSIGSSLADSNTDANTEN